MSASRGIVIIGSGIAGTTIAYELTRRGHRVTMLEVGVEYPYPYSKQFSDEVLHQYRDPQYAAPADLRNLEVSGDSGVGPALVLEQHFLVGGMATRWSAWTPRYLPSNFTSQSQLGFGVDWPVSYAELEPFYCRAEALIGVSGTDADNPWAPPRSSPYPLPEFEFANDDKILGARLEKNGIHIHTVPQARTRKPYGDRMGCANFGTCGVCPIGARYSPRYHLALAEKTGLLTLHKRAAVRRIVADQPGAASAVAYHPDNGQKVEELGAKLVVVAAGALESARLLLLSAQAGGHARALNASEQVGRNLTFSHVWSARLKYKELLYPGRIGAKSAQSYQFIDPPGRRKHGGLKIDFSSVPANLMFRDYAGRGGGVWGDAGVSPNLVTWESGDAALAAIGPMRQQRDFGLHAETAPTDRKFVELSTSLRDRFGEPFAHVHHESSDFDDEGRLFAVRVAKEFAEKSGAVDYETSATMKGAFNTGHHHLGTCRMGKSARDSVVDSFGAAHGFSNVYLAGGSIFAGASSLNPTLTIVALALRTADHIASRLGSP